MSRSYKFRDQSKPYFITFAIVNWVDLFTRKEYVYLLIDAIRYCQKEKGLLMYAWVIMPSHVHMIIGTTSEPMENIVRDLKSFTSRKIRKEIKEHPGESRKEWLLWMFELAGKKNGNNKNWQLWQQHNQPVELWDAYMADNKLNYLHNNPVKAGFVANPEDYLWSSATDYAGGKGWLQIVRIN